MDFSLDEELTMVRDMARDFAENDPFNKAGLFETVSVTPWRKAFFNFENLT